MNELELLATIVAQQEAILQIMQYTPTPNPTVTPVPTSTAMAAGYSFTTTVGVTDTVDIWVNPTATVGDFVQVIPAFLMVLSMVIWLFYNSLAGRRLQ